MEPSTGLCRPRGVVSFPARPIQLIAASALACAITGCSTASAPQRSGAAYGATTTNHTDRPDPCLAEVRGKRLVARLAYGGDVFLPPNGITPRTTAAVARATLLADPSVSLLGHHHHQQEIFAIYQNFKGRRPVWILLEHQVPSSGSLSGSIVKHDLVDILDDRTRQPVAVIDALPDGCRHSTSAR